MGSHMFLPMEDVPEGAEIGAILLFCGNSLYARKRRARRMNICSYCARSNCNGYIRDGGQRFSEFPFVNEILHFQYVESVVLPAVNENSDFDTAGHALLSFMERFSGYNKISMYPEDMEKTAFSTRWGTYCYKVMPFGLKNAEATYQRAATTILHDMIHKEVEVYVDDMIVNVQVVEEGSAHTVEFPMSRSLRQSQGILLNPSVLMLPIKRKPLLLCLSIGQFSMGSMLAQKDKVKGVEQAIYYLSKKFLEYEVRYTSLEKTYTALIWATRRLRQYMVAYLIRLISKMDPIKYLLNPALTGRTARWLLLLSEFDITYVNQKSIKGRAIVDHGSTHPTEDGKSLDDAFPYEEFMTVEEENSVNAWQLYFDRAANQRGYGAGVLLITPDEFCLPSSFRLDFSCINNITEYEAYAIGLKIALTIGVKKIQVFSDSSIVICRTQGKWKTRDEKVKRYQEYLEKISKHFEEISFKYFQRDSNQFVDALATLVSMVECSPMAQGREIPYGSKIRGKEVSQKICHPIHITR
ncbi:uncharacterized protein LOC122084904 [Macadamia integrifolia]|uniref:uncharacterized protein LOC122084904 n=1 Tax=Macadamia integrifolia TaxID=60698 RepID=UPI001C4F0532|nr:uncharacterized protein LOC122084904 [Macadamia integrifolia]